MDINTIIERPILVNFRAPRATIELLDQVSRFDNRTRTSVMLDLINNWLAEKTREIPQRIQAKNDLKTALNSHEQSAREFRQAVSINRSEITSRNEAKQVLAPVFSTSAIDLNENEFGRNGRW
jgi:hypothetical protein